MKRNRDSALCCERSHAKSNPKHGIIELEEKSGILLKFHCGQDFLLIFIAVGVRLTGWQRRDRMDLTEVACCGLYCGLCASRRRIPEQANALRQSLHLEGYDLGYFDIPELENVFSQFWQGLNRLAETPCPGCRAGGGNPGCEIRQCVQDRGVTACPLCSEFPCERLELLQHYPTFLADVRRMKAIGIEMWIAEQEQRAERGFSYADVRHPTG
jgi:hypothetical protein